MERRVLWRVALLVAALAIGCGGDDSGDGDSEGGSGGNDGRAGTGAVGGGRIEGEGIPCGTTHCTMAEGSMVGPCCYDMFDSICGMMGGFTGTSCVGLVPVDTRCPPVSVGPFMLENCCTPSNMCGIQDNFFGGGCIELAEAERMAMERIAGAGDEDGGMGQVPPFMIDFPESRACE